MLSLALAAMALTVPAAGALAVAVPVGATADAVVHLVDVFNFGYRDHASDTVVTVASVGDVVRFQLVSGTHTVTSGVGSKHFPDLGDLDSPSLSPRSPTWDYVASEPGVFPYTCRPHPNMNAVLVVVE